MEVVVDQLVHEERKLKDHQSGTGSEGALITINKPRDCLGRVRCYCCGKIGHMQKDCFKRDKRSKLTAKKQLAGQKGSVDKKKPTGTKTNTIGLLASEAHALSAKTQTRNWIIDSGATSHICCNKSMFVKLENMTASQAITLGDGRSITAHSQGNVEVRLKQLDGTYKNATLHNVLFVPEIAYNLLTEHSKSNRVWQDHQI